MIIVEFVVHPNAGLSTHFPCHIGFVMEEVRDISDVTRRDRCRNWSDVIGEAG